MKNPFPRQVKRIGVAAPASSADRSRFASSGAWLRERGIELVEGEHLFSGVALPYLSASDDDRADKRRDGGFGDKPVSHIRGEPDMRMIRKPCQNSLFVGNADIECIGKHDGRFFAGIVIATIYGESRYRIAGYAQTVANSLFQVIRMMVKRQSDIGQSKHNGQDADKIMPVLRHGTSGCFRTLFYLAVQSASIFV